MISESNDLNLINAENTLIMSYSIGYIKTSIKIL